MNENNKPTILTSISALLIYGSLLASIILFAYSHFSTAIILFGICLIAGLVILVYVRIKYPEHDGSKAVLFVTLVIIAFIVIIIGILVWTCMSACDSCCRSFE